MPLVFADLPVGTEADLAGADRRVQRVKKQYAEGELVQVAGARHQAEAELIQGLLMDAGVPSMLRRTRGFDVPDMLAAGPRDVMVPLSGAETAREVLLDHGMAPQAGDATDPPWRVLAGLTILFALVALVLWAGTELLA
jgi:hypothetical protein